MKMLPKVRRIWQSGKVRATEAPNSKTLALDGLSKQQAPKAPPGSVQPESPPST